MAEKCIVPNEWEEYLDNLSKKIKAMDEAVEIDIVAPSVLEEKEAKRLKLSGISFDPKDRVLSIFCEVLDHLINKPQEVCVEEENGAVSSLRVTDGSGLEHIIKFSRPIA